MKGGVAILISDKIDLKIKMITRGKEGHYIMTKGSIQEEDITMVNIYVPNIWSGLPWKRTEMILSFLRLHRVPHFGLVC